MTPPAQSRAPASRYRSWSVAAGVAGHYRCNPQMWEVAAVLERDVHTFLRDVQYLYVIIYYLYNIYIFKVCFDKVLIKKHHMKLLIKLYKAVQAVLLASWFWSFMYNRESVLKVVIFCNFNRFMIEERKEYFLRHHDSCGRCVF